MIVFQQQQKSVERGLSCAKINIKEHFINNAAFKDVFVCFIPFPSQVRHSADLQGCAQLVCQGGAHGGEAAGE